MKKKTIIILILVLVLVAIALIAVDLLIPREGVNEKAINTTIEKEGKEYLEKRNTFAYSIQKEDNVVKVITYDQYSPFKLVLNFYLKDDKVTHATFDRHYVNKLEAIVYKNDNGNYPKVNVHNNIVSGDVDTSNLFGKTSAEIMDIYTKSYNPTLKIE